MTSVPVKDALASVVGEVVNNPTYSVVGAAPHAPDDGHVTPFIHPRILFWACVVKPAIIVFLSSVLAHC